MEKLLFAAVVLSLYWNTGTDFSTLNVPVLSSLLFLMVLSPMCSAIIYLPGEFGGFGLQQATVLTRFAVPHGVVTYVLSHQLLVR